MATATPDADAENSRLELVRRMDRRLRRGRAEGWMEASDGGVGVGTEP